MLVKAVVISFLKFYFSIIPVHFLLNSNRFTRLGNTCIRVFGLIFSFILLFHTSMILFYYFKPKILESILLKRSIIFNGKIFFSRIPSEQKYKYHSKCSEKGSFLMYHKIVIFPLAHRHIRLIQCSTFLLLIN